MALCIQDREPVFELQHVKHDFIEKNDTFTVYIYVKETNKNAVRIDFEPQTLVVRFQTGDKKFLQEHKTNEDAIFLWKIQLRGEIFPEKSKYKITKTLIDITLGKKEFARWDGLEALERKRYIGPSESPNQPTNTWRNINLMKQAALPSSRQSSEDENQARKESDLKRGKSERKENRTNQNESRKENVAQQKSTCNVYSFNKNAVSPGMTGLDNLGNTCFMNSVFQCLANTREFRDIFLDESFQKYRNTSNPFGYGGELADSFADLMKGLWSENRPSYAPKKLKSLIAIKASQFTGFAQHDAQEFMTFLLDGLHEDLNRIKKITYTQTVEDKGRPDEDVASETLEVYKKRNDSFIMDMFLGQYKTTFECQECKEVSKRFDPFLYLTLPLQKEQNFVREVENDESMTEKVTSNAANLKQCLELFTEPEVLSQEAALYCPKCEKHTEAKKQMLIWKLPHTLIVHLKRISCTNYNLRYKIDRMVEFPVRSLDLSPYYAGNRPVNEPFPIYDLYAVVNHHGGILGGHYTAYVRCADPNDYNKNLVGWRICDDSRVSNISDEQNVVTRAAYLLFYRQRKPFVLPITIPEGDKKKEEQEVAANKKLRCNSKLMSVDSSNTCQI